MYKNIPHTRTRPPLYNEIVEAQKQSKSHAEAARLLNISQRSYKKWALLYGLYTEEHKNVGGKGIKKLREKGSFGLEEILNGKHPNYNRVKLKARLIKSGKLAKECYYCGFNKSRPDGNSPLVLCYHDGDRYNLQLENLFLSCYNCYYLTTGVIGQAAYKIQLNTTSVEPNTITPEELAGDLDLSEEEQKLLQQEFIDEL